MCYLRLLFLISASPAKQKDTQFKMLNSYKFKFTMGVPTPKHPRLR